MNKLLVTTFIVLISIGTLSFDDFLGKNIKNISYDLTEVDSELKTYSLSNQKVDFLSKSIDQVILTTNKNNIIVSIGAEFEGIFDKNFFNELVLAYGEPSHMLKNSKIINEKTETLEKGVTAKSSESELVECKFEDKPMFILWNMPNKKITITMQRPISKTFVVIKKK